MASFSTGTTTKQIVNELCNIIPFINKFFHALFNKYTVNMYIILNKD